MNVLDIIHTAETNPPAAENLPAEIASYEDAENPEVRSAWQIETLQSADWALARLAECEAEAAEIERQAEAARMRVNQRAAELILKARRGAGFFRFKLTDYAIRHRSVLLTGKKKSRDFIHGRIGWRAKPERLVVDDPAALEAWLLAQPVERGLYRLRVEPELRALHALYAEEGQVPPGCRISAEPEAIKIDAFAPESSMVKP